MPVTLWIRFWDLAGKPLYPKWRWYSNGKKMEENTSNPQNGSVGEWQRQKTAGSRGMVEEKKGLYLLLNHLSCIEAQKRNCLSRYLLALVMINGRNYLV